MHVSRHVTTKSGLAAAALGFMLAAAPGALAAPMSPATAAVPSVLAETSLLTRASGRHNDCRRHYVPRWGTTARHRHVGPGEVPVACGRRWDGRGDPPQWRNRGCFRIGPVWYCP